VKRALLRATAAAALLLLLFTALALPRLGAWLVVEDPLAKADGIYVLGGTMYERPLEALDLYQAGWAPTIVLVQQIADWGELWLNDHGVKVTTELEIQIDLLERMGVPRDAIASVKPMGSTAEEAGALLAFMNARGWSTVIVVTSKQHTRRAGLSMRRALGGDKKVIIRSSRYDRAEVERWWTNRATLRFTLFETQRYLAYWLGIAD
jgi:uncharacterized SAM-binding protein YcdF (DUF218 family)